MTADLSLNRPGDASPVSPGARPDPSYARLSMSATLSPFPPDYVGALNGALGQLDINAMASRVPQPQLTQQRQFQPQAYDGLSVPTPDASMGSSSPDFTSRDARCLPLPGGSTYQSGYPMPLNTGGAPPMSPGGTNYGMQGYFPLVVSWVRLSPR